MKIKADAEKEAVLLALDQLSQTMDVMRQVVSRLKRKVEVNEKIESTGEASGRSAQAKQEPAQASTEASRDNERPVVLH